MNHCLLEVKVKEVPTIRYTQDNQTPLAEMEVSFEGLRTEDPEGSLKVIGWGNLAQDLQNNIQPGEKLIIEGRLRMNTIPRQDGTKEKKAEFTLSRFHSIGKTTVESQKPFQANKDSTNKPLTTNKPSNTNPSNTNPAPSSNEDLANWNSSPLIPDNDEIPF